MFFCKARNYFFILRYCFFCIITCHIKKIRLSKTRTDGNAYSNLRSLLFYKSVFNVKLVLSYGLITTLMIL